MHVRMKVEFRSGNNESVIFDVNDAIGIRRDIDSGKIVMDTCSNVVIAHLSRKGYWHLDVDAIRKFGKMEDIQRLATTPMSSAILYTMG